MIRLTNAHDGRPLYLNSAHVVAVLHKDAEPNRAPFKDLTRVLTSTGVVYLVTEAPQQIAEAIEEALNE